MKSLLSITDDLRALDDLLAEAGGDISDPKVAETIHAWFADLDADLHKKADNYAALIAEMRGRAEMRKEHAERLALKAKRDEEAAAYLSLALMGALESRGLKKIETERFTLSVAGNGGKQPLAISEDVPPEWCKKIERIEPDKDRIRAALEAGEALPFASLEPRGKRLSIR